MYKKVSLPIEVPDNIYCWDWQSDSKDFSICPHFENEGGWSRCDIMPLREFMSLRNGSGSFIKPEQCRELEEIK